MLPNLTENEFYFVREAFCGIEYAENAFVVGAGEATPFLDLTPFGGFGASRPSILAPSALGLPPYT